VAAHPLCRKCDGTGWIPYRSETVDGELEEAYRLCPNCYAPRHCMGFKTDHPCPRPGTVRYGLGYYCIEHIEVLYTDEGLGNLHEAIYYLRCWLCTARDRANEFLETQLSEALGKAETCLRRRIEQELDRTRESTGDLN
jgi:hypothetical protein